MNLDDFFLTVVFALFVAGVDTVLESIYRSYQNRKYADLKERWRYALRNGYPTLNLPDLPQHILADLLLEELSWKEDNDVFR